MYFSGCDHGDRLKLAQIQKLVEDDMDMQSLSKAQQQKFINDLQVHRNTIHVGACKSNNAAAVDCRGAVARISTKVCIS